MRACHASLTDISDKCPWWFAPCWMYCLSPHTTCPGPGTAASGSGLASRHTQARTASSMPGTLTRLCDDAAVPVSADGARTGTAGAAGGSRLRPPGAKIAAAEGRAPGRLRQGPRPAAPPPRAPRARAAAGRGRPPAPQTWRETMHSPRHQARVCACPDMGSPRLARHLHAPDRRPSWPTLLLLECSTRARQHQHAQPGPCHARRDVGGYQAHHLCNSSLAGALQVYAGVCQRHTALEP